MATKALGNTFRRGGIRKGRLAKDPRITIERKPAPRKAPQGSRFNLSSGRTLFVGKDDRMAPMRPKSTIAPR